MEIKIKLKLKRVITGLLLTSSLITSATAFSVFATSFEVGTGIYDITGPAAEIGMFGYFNSEQSAQGIHQRLRSRAFAVHKPEAGTRLMFVSADLPAMFQSIKIEVINRLKNKYGDLYTDENVMLTATHTHVGPGGLSHYGLYILASTTGYSPQNFEVVVNGIVKSIVRAHNNLASGTISYNKGELLNTSKNRSLVAYNANPNAQNCPETNPDMTVLKFEEFRQYFETIF